MATRGREEMVLGSQYFGLQAHVCVLCLAPKLKVTAMNDGDRTHRGEVPTLTREARHVIDSDATTVKTKLDKNVTKLDKTCSEEIIPNNDAGEIQTMQRIVQPAPRTQSDTRRWHQYFDKRIEALAQRLHR